MQLKAPTNFSGDWRKKSVIRLPNNWNPRPYQLPTLKALDEGFKRIVSIWHRRSGKDNTAANYTACAAHRQIGTYWHVLPTLKQARKSVWQVVDNDGRRLIDQAFPKELRRRTLEDEMLIEFKNGSFWQLVGGDNYDALVGANPRGVTFSEWALTDPRAWVYIEPILEMNGGWAWWITTPRGMNHAHKLWTTCQELMNKGDPEWFGSLLSIDDTKLLNNSHMDRLRAQGRSEEYIQQEYYCSFTTSNEGAIYGRQIMQLEKDGRIASVPHDAAYPTETWWDFGLRNATAIWFVQRVRNELRFIDFICDKNKMLPHYLSEVHKRGYSYNRHLVPHDGGRVWLGSGQTFADIARNHGIQFTQAPKLSLENGIEASRALLSKCTFDAKKCDFGVKALKSYHYEKEEDPSGDPMKDTFSQKPVHDWSSDPADAFRTGAVTPDGYGVIPDWMREEMESSALNPAMMGENQRDDYDPLSAYR